MSDIDRRQALAVGQLEVARHPQAEVAAADSNGAIAFGSWT